MAEIDELRTRMSALEELVRDLHHELARAAVGRFGSMRDTRRCPACGGGHLLHIPAAKEMTYGGVAPLTVHHHKKGWWLGTVDPRGPLEYFVCRGCRLIESHATDLEGVEPDGKDVIAIDPDPEKPPEGPFR